MICCVLAVPVAQLRTIALVTQCCCPDQSRCHCPDHKPDHGKGPSMRACHKTQHELVSPDAPELVVPAIAVLDVPVRPIPGVVVPLRSPHQAPAPARPDAPS